MFFLSLLLSLLCLTHTTLNTFPTKMIVNVPVADLRILPENIDPSVTLPTSDISNHLQITQLLMNEHIVAHESYTDSFNQLWYKVSALQQARYDSVSKWHGYPGWILAKDTLEVHDYPVCNSVITQHATPVFDHQNNLVLTLSIGTRVQVVQMLHTKYCCILPYGIKGYIDKNALLPIQPTIEKTINTLRTEFVQTAHTFLGFWYSWGGRSTQQDQYISSVDCSALVNLSFLTLGLQTPRMSHEQYLASHRIHHGKDLQIGDLVFFCSTTKHINRMNHVMIYIGNEQLLESTLAGDEKVRIIDFEKRMGKPRHMIQTEDICKDETDEYHVYFGTFFTAVLLQQLRNEALSHNYQEAYCNAFANINTKNMPIDFYTNH
ncbi:C40 family peptidase [Candidatus Babeliales bacterium]|nr:C40 family peptidase [Candidatus Babeliales bacterium]